MNDQRTLRIGRPCKCFFDCCANRRSEVRLVRRSASVHQIEDHLKPSDYVADFQELLLLFDTDRQQRSDCVDQQTGIPDRRQVENGRWAPVEERKNRPWRRSGTHQELRAIEWQPPPTGRAPLQEALCVREVPERCATHDVIAGLDPAIYPLRKSNLFNNLSLFKVSCWPPLISTPRSPHPALLDLFAVRKNVVMCPERTYSDLTTETAPT